MQNLQAMCALVYTYMSPDSLATFYRIGKIVGTATAIGGSLIAVIRYGLKLYHTARAIRESVSQLTDMDIPHITWGVEGIKTDVADMKSDVRVLGSQLSSHDDRLGSLQRASENLGVALVNHLDNGSDAKVREVAESAIQTVAQASASALSTVADAAQMAKTAVYLQADKAKKAVLADAKNARDVIKHDAKTAKQRLVLAKTQRVPRNVLIKKSSSKIKRKKKV